MVLRSEPPLATRHLGQNGASPQVLEELTARTFKKRERTNRLLLLMQLHANRQDDERAYAKSIRTWLEANQGRPGVLRRAVTDRDSKPSLR